MAGDGKCYLFTNTALTWAEAVLHCEGLPQVTVFGQARDPSLLCIESDEERNMFSSVLPEAIQAGVRFWFNCNDKEQEGTWICKTDREGTQSSYRSKNIEIWDSFIFKGGASGRDGGIKCLPESEIHVSDQERSGWGNRALFFTQAPQRPGVGGGGNCSLFSVFQKTEQIHSANLISGLGHTSSYK